jgi:adenosine deaminase
LVVFNRMKNVHYMNIGWSNYQRTYKTNSVNDYQAKSFKEIERLLKDRTIDEPTRQIRMNDY